MSLSLSLSLRFQMFLNLGHSFLRSSNLSTTLLRKIIPYLFKRISLCDRFIFDLIVRGLLCKSKTPTSSCVQALFLPLVRDMPFCCPYDLCFCAEKVIPERHVSCLQKVFVSIILNPCVPRRVVLNSGKGALLFI